MPRNKSYQGGKDLYTKNYKTWLKEIKDTYIKGKTSCDINWKTTVHTHTYTHSKVKRYTVKKKMPILPKSVYRFNAISINTSMEFFAEIEKFTQNSLGISKTPNSQNNF